MKINKSITDVEFFKVSCRIEILTDPIDFYKILLDSKESYWISLLGNRFDIDPIGF
jgi:hypothetical protein